MAAIESILESKIELLENSGDKFISNIERTQLELYKEALSLLNEFNVKDGRLVLDSANMALIESIDAKLREVMSKGEYFEATKQLIQSFDKSIELSNEYYSREIKKFQITDVLKNVYSVQRVKMIDTFISNSSMDAAFLQPVKDLLLQSLTQQTDLKQLTQGIKDIALGTEDYSGKLMRYSKQIALDTLNISDRVYNTTVSSEFNLVFYKYLGGKKDTTRCFCKQRLRKVFHRREIEDWARGNVKSGLEDDANYKSCGKDWQGKYRDTNATNIFNVLGGYNCLHSLAPKSLASVPKEVILRAINKNYLSLTEKEKKELNL